MDVHRRQEDAHLLPVARRRIEQDRLQAVVAQSKGDLGSRGFAAVEVYPEAAARENSTPAARPRFWIRAGFVLAVDDDRYPVLRREL